tara:strand:+ start:3020 stop:4045 length:1026 start_codon:yes stop_codon:yes gene_type:complete
MGKKSNPPPPDYKPLADASAAAARIQGELGQAQLDFAKQQYDENSPILKSIAEQQMAAQKQQMTQAKDYYDYQVDTFRPLEKGLVADAERFNTESYREQASGQAAADAGRAFGISQQQNQRAMASMGVNPNSGRFAGMNAASGIQQAAVRANAMTGARTQAEQMGYARKLDAAGLGRGLAGASTAAYGGANNAGNSAGGNAQSAGNTYMQGMGMGAGTIGAGQNMQIQGLGTVLNNQTQTYVNSQDSLLGDIGGLMGGAASMYTAFGSDRKIKENIVEVGVDQRTALTLYEFNYIGGDGRRFRGVMADEVELVYPEAVVDTDQGHKAVRYDLLNIAFQEVQ